MQGPALQEFQRRQGGTGQFISLLLACNADLPAAYQQWYEMTGYNAALPRQTWERISQMIVEETRRRQVMVPALQARASLVESPPIYVTVYTEHQQSDLDRARQTINSMATPEMVDLDFLTMGVPVPMQFLDTQIDMRTAAAPLPGNTTLITQWSAVAGPKIAEENELNLANGNTAMGVRDEQGTLHVMYGYTTHPQRNQVAPGAAWTDFAAINNSFQNYMNVLRDTNFYYGPYDVFVATDVLTILKGRNLSGSERTYLQLLEDEPEINMIAPSQDLAAGELVMMDPNPNVVKLIIEAPVQLSDWDAMGPMGTQYRMWGIQAPFLKSTYSGRSGILHSTGIAAA